MNVKSVAIMLSVPAAMAAAPAVAAPFYAVEVSGGAYQGQFRVTADLLASPAETGDDYFVIENVAGRFDGRWQRLPSVTFATTAWDGGLVVELPGDDFRGLLGEQLFTGTTAAPVLRLGTFSLASDVDGSSFIVTIGQGVPEPATWALMIAGLGATGAAMRRRRSRTTVRFA